MANKWLDLQFFIYVLLLIIQLYITRFDECHGINVRCGAVHRDHELYLSSASGGRGADSLLPWKSCWHVLSFPICVWPGECSSWKSILHAAFSAACCLLAHVLESRALIWSICLLAGCHWAPIRTGSGYSIQCRVRVDGCQVLLVPLLWVLHDALLHIIFFYCFQITN